jgi:hypothetical protein
MTTKESLVRNYLTEHEVSFIADCAQRKNARQLLQTLLDHAPFRRWDRLVYVPDVIRALEFELNHLDGK